MDIRLGSFVVIVEILYPDKRSVACRFWLHTNCSQTTLNISRFNVICLHKPRGPFLPMLIAFIFASLFHVLGQLEMLIKFLFYRKEIQVPFGGGMIFYEYTIRL
jgi:hypothetical protein